MKTLHCVAVLAAMVSLVVGCRKDANRTPDKEYEVIGKVVAVDATKKTVTLDHQDIPGLMNAMQMEFKVDDPKILERVGEGDEVQGQLEVRSGAYIITTLKKR